MEKMNEALEGFLREITPYSGRPYPFSVAFADKYSYNELVQKRTFLEELVQLGFVKATDETAPVASSINRYSIVEFPDFFSLTSNGETYFESKDASIKEERRSKWEDRAWQVFIAVLGVVLSIIASIVTVNVKLGQ